MYTWRPGLSSRRSRLRCARRGRVRGHRRRGAELERGTPSGRVASRGCSYRITVL